jgi:hypothetical protein
MTQRSLELRRVISGRFGRRAVQLGRAYGPGIEIKQCRSVDFRQHDIVPAATSLVLTSSRVERAAA